MTIIAIVDGIKSTEKQAANIALMRKNYYNSKEHETMAAIDCIHHYFGHNCAATVVKMKQAFLDYGTKESVEAFAFLAYEFTGAKADNSKDKERHDKAAPLYQKELDAIEEQGLTVWYKGKMASAEPEKEEETKEQKAAKKEKRAEAKKQEVGKEYMEDLLKDDPSMKLAMEWREAYNALALADPKQAAEMAQADIKQLGDSLATKIQNLQAA